MAPQLGMSTGPSSPETGPVARSAKPVAEGLRPLRDGKHRFRIVAGAAAVVVLMAALGLGRPYLQRKADTRACEKFYDLAIKILDDEPVSPAEIRAVANDVAETASSEAIKRAAADLATVGGAGGIGGNIARSIAIGKIAAACPHETAT